MKCQTHSLIYMAWLATLSNDRVLPISLDQVSIRDSFSVASLSLSFRSSFPLRSSSFSFIRANFSAITYSFFSRLFLKVTLQFTLDIVTKIWVASYTVVALLAAFPTFLTQTSRTKTVKNRAFKAIHSKKINGLEKEDRTWRPVHDCRSKRGFKHRFLVFTALFSWKGCHDEWNLIWIRDCRGFRGSKKILGQITLGDN